MFPKINSLVNILVSGIVIMLILWGLAFNMRPGKELLLILIGFIGGFGIFIFFDTWCLRLYAMNKLERVAGSGFKTAGIVLLILSFIISLVMLFAVISALMDLPKRDDVLRDRRIILSLITIGIMVLGQLSTILNVIFFIKALKKNNSLYSGMINAIGEEPADTFTVL